MRIAVNFDPPKIAVEFREEKNAGKVVEILEVIPKTFLCPTRAFVCRFAVLLRGFKTFGICRRSALGDPERAPQVFFSQRDQYRPGAAVVEYGK